MFNFGLLAARTLGILLLLGLALPGHGEILDRAEMRGLLFPELSRAARLHRGVRPTLRLTPPRLLNLVGTLKTNLADGQVVTPKGDGVAHRYAARLAAVGLSFKLSTSVQAAALKPSELTVMLNPEELDESEPAPDIVARINLRHEADHARTYLEFRAGVVSPWLIHFDAERGTHLSADSNSYENHF